MAEEGEDQDSKTEQPSARRLEEAYKRGQVPNSREVSHFFLLLVLAATLTAFAPHILHSLKDLLMPFLQSPEEMQVDANSIGALLTHGFGHALLILMLPMGFAVIAALAASFLQHGIIFSVDPITPKLSKISLIKGIGRLFSRRSLVELIKNILKLAVVGSIAWFAFAPMLDQLQRLPDRETIGLLIFLGIIAKRIMIAICVAMFFIALFDFIYQRFEFIKSMRMSKQELKDEYKQQEGDPIIKQRLRQLRMERAKNRMMSNVPKADVVITNPTHYSIALIYDTKKMSAPKVVAKGLDLVALRIREVAREHNIPLVENVALARALYTVELDKEVPVEHYQAVAQIISYVYRLKGKMA